MLACVLACGARPAPDSGHASAILQHVASLAGEIGPRPGDTRRSQEALAYIERQLAASSIPHEREPVGRVALPEIAVLGTVHRAARIADSSDPNLVVRLGPPARADRKALLVIAHYDTVEATPGAVDNAAAVGVVIELARMLATESPPQPVILAFTANEEVGLVGAEALAAHHRDEVGFAIALDLVGGSGELTLNGASALIGGAELAWIADAADRAGVVVRTPLAHRVISRWWPQAERSDHAPFTRRGVRAVHFYHRGQDGDWIDLAYHGERDTLERVHRASVDAQLRLLHALATTPIPAHAGDGVWVPVVRNTVVPRWAWIAGCLACIAGALALARTWPRRRPHAPDDRLGLAAGLGCFAVAVAIAYAVERITAGDHPAPWLHAPGRAVVAELLVLAGVLGLATRLLGRRWRWTGERRYRAVAIAVPGAFGTLLLAIGAAELAWIWLVPALLAALAPRLGRLEPVAIAGLALPVALVLWPAQLREAAWNGFLSSSVPLIAWIAAFALPGFAGLAGYLRARPSFGPLGTLVLSVGCLLAIAAGIGLLVAGAPACTGLQFHAFHLACEAPPGVH